MRRSRALAQRTLALVAAVGVLPPAAMAQGEVKLRMSMQLSHDSNLFRLDDERDVRSIGFDKRSDLVSNITLGLDADVPISQQHFQFSLQASDVRYQSADSLDYTGSNISTAWLWQFGKRARGSLGAQREEVLSDFADALVVQRNIRVKTNVYGSARYWLSPDWWLTGRLEQVALRNDAVQRSSDRDDNYASLGVEYRTQADNSVLLQWRHIDGNAPNDFEFQGFVFDNDFKQNDLETALDWRNGFWRTRARIGYTERKHTDFADRDFSGITGSWSQDWFATGQLAVNFTARREIGSYQDFTANYIETSSISLTPTWALSEKLRLQAGLELRRRDYKGDPEIFQATGSRRSDDITSLSVSASFAPRRNIDFALSLRQQERRSNTTGFDYDATSLDASVSIGF